VTLSGDPSGVQNLSVSKYLVLPDGAAVKNSETWLIWGGAEWTTQTDSVSAVRPPPAPPAQGPGQFLPGGRKTGPSSPLSPGKLKLIR
jgi:hypothetical protein